MKRAISIILLLLISSNIAFAAETEYEKKLEYKRKKIVILVKTRTIGETNAYSTTDTWSNTVSPEAGYSQTYSSATTNSGSTFGFREVSDWVIIRGGVRELADVAFLEITGNAALAAEIQKKSDESEKWRTIGAITGITGLVIAIAGASASSTGAIAAGSILSLVGFTVSSLNTSPKHYIAADYALELADKYNIKLKKDLGLPVNFE